MEGFEVFSVYVVGQDSVIATYYRLDDLGIESQWATDFPDPSKPPLGPTQPPIQWVPGISWG
jgi:hypothetical protein